MKQDELSPLKTILNKSHLEMEKEKELKRGSFLQFTLLNATRSMKTTRYIVDQIDKHT
jgi:hypothetical protein